jgi:hypothetical protein
MSESHVSDWPLCDTCGKPSKTVSRVTIDNGYNRANAKAIFNCPECFEAKRRERQTAEKANAENNTFPKSTPDE